MAAGQKKSPTIQIRRATPMDVTNIFRLVRRKAETDKPHFLGIPEEHRGLLFILDLIKNGYVIVADLSGRIVGVLGCSAYEPAYRAKGEWVLDAEFFATAPGFESNGTGARLIHNLRTFVRKINIPLRLMSCSSDLKELEEELLTKMGFENAGTIYVLRARENEQEEDDERRRETDNDLGDETASVAGSGPGGHPSEGPEAS